MAPSASESEGEIIESDFDKATTAQPAPSNTSVNRKLRDALSPSPVRSVDSASPSANSRDRSRSPYRASRSPRGEKRRRDDHDPRRHDRHHHDSRRFRGHQHDKKSRDFDASDNRHRRDGHHRNLSKRFDGHDDFDRSRDSKRPRTRSRSPDRKHPDSQNRGTSDRGRKDEYRRGGANEKYSSFESHRNEQSSEHMNRDAAHGHPNANNPQPQKKADQNFKFSMRGHGSGREDRNHVSGSTDRPTDVDMEPAAESGTQQVPMELSIEERRRRREAIKAKYQSQQAPLLAQALLVDHPSASTPSMSDAKSPASDRALSTQPDSPNPQQIDSAPGSPPSLAVSDDADLARPALPNDSDVHAEEPSAADYDPSMDMQEDKVRQGQRNQLHHLPGPVNGQAYLEDQSVDVPQPSIEPQQAADTIASKNKDSAKDDMFASDNDDDDDIFAPVTVAKRPDSKDGSQNASIAPKARQLDMSLLDNWDDPDGYYRIILEELLDNRYHVQANLGRGMFSSVVRAMDNKTNSLVAIKIIRNNESMIKAGTKEMEILQKLADSDPDDKKHLIRLHRSFTHKGHLCMVFENLSINLREVLKKFGRDVGINLKAVRSYAQQMFLGLSLLRKCNILHADVKPDNMLVNENRNMLKICDLGSAADASDNDITPYLVSRFYRAPEIILGIPIDFAIDMWSVGCTLFELYTGKILFTGRDNNQMLKSIMECRGKFSLKMLKKAEYGALHFDDQNLHFRSSEVEKATGKNVTRLINFVRPTRDLKTRLLAAAGSGLQSGTKTLPEAELKELNLFADLLDRCLALNPERRLKPTDALKHPFIYRAVGTASK